MVKKKKKSGGKKALTTDIIRKFADDLEKGGKNSDISYQDMCKLWSYAASTANGHDSQQENPDSLAVTESVDQAEAKNAMDMSGGDESSGEKVDPETYAKMMSQLSDSTMLDDGDDGENGDDTADLQNDDSEEDEEGLQLPKAGVKRKAQEIAQPNPKKQLTNNKKAKPV